MGDCQKTKLSLTGNCLFDPLKFLFTMESIKNGCCFILARIRVMHCLFVSFAVPFSLENVDERQDTVFLTMKYYIVELAKMAILPEQARGKGSR